MKIVDVLGAEEETVFEFGLEFREREVRGIRLAGQGSRTTHGIEFPDQLRIASPGSWRCDLLKPPSFPKTVGIAKGGDAALGADAGTGENEETVGGLERDHEGKAKRQKGKRQKLRARQA